MKVSDICILEVDVAGQETIHKLCHEKEVPGMALGFVSIFEERGLREIRLTRARVSDQDREQIEFVFVRNLWPEETPPTTH